MGLISALTKAGLAKKAVDEARKPHNQARIKQIVARLSRRGAPQSGAR